MTHMTLSHVIVYEYTYSEHGRKEYAFDGAAGHHVRGMPLLSPLGVINSFPPLPIFTECQ